MTVTATKVVKARTTLRQMSLFEYQGELFYGAGPDENGHVHLERDFNGNLLEEFVDLIFLRPERRSDLEGWYPVKVKFDNGASILHRQHSNSVYVSPLGNPKRITNAFALALIESNDGDGKELRNFEENNR